MNSHIFQLILCVIIDRYLSAEASRVRARAAASLAVCAAAVACEWLVMITKARECGQHGREGANGS